MKATVVIEFSKSINEKTSTMGVLFSYWVGYKNVLVFSSLLSLWSNGEEQRTVGGKFCVTDINQVFNNVEMLLF